MKKITIVVLILQIALFAPYAYGAVIAGNGNNAQSILSKPISVTPVYVPEQISGVKYYPQSVAEQDEKNAIATKKCKSVACLEARIAALENQNNALETRINNLERLWRQRQK